MDLRNLEEENDEFSERRKFQQPLPLRSEREARAAEERKESRGGEGKDLELGIAEHASG